MKDYHINVFYSEEDEGYIADILDLEHCSAFGNTPDEALKEVLRSRENKKVNRDSPVIEHTRGKAF